MSDAVKTVPTTTQANPPTLAQVAKAAGMDFIKTDRFTAWINLRNLQTIYPSDFSPAQLRLIANQIEALQK